MLPLATMIMVKMELMVTYSNLLVTTMSQRANGLKLTVLLLYQEMLSVTDISSIGSLLTRLKKVHLLMISRI